MKKTENNNPAGGRHEDLNEEALKRASELIDALLDDHVSEETREKISGWFKSDVSVGEKYAALQSIMRSLEPNLKPDRYEYEQLAEIRAKLGLPQEENTASARKTNPLRRTALRVAAVMVPVAIALGAAWFVWNGRGGKVTEPVFTEISVPATSAADREIALADDSQVRVAPGSKLTYSDTFEADRKVNLTGEAFFDVTRLEGEDPFTVDTEHLTVTVLGTEFRVEAHPGSDHSTVTLYSGKIEVTVKADGVSTVMSPGEMFDYNHISREVTSSSVSAEYMISNGFVPGLVFNDATFADIIRSVEANYGVNFEIPAGTDLQQGRYSIDLTGEGLQGALELLSMLNNSFSFSVDGDKVIMSKQ